MVITNLYVKPTRHSRAQTADLRRGTPIPCANIPLFLYLTLCTRRLGGYTLPGGLGSDADQQRVRNWSSTTRKILHAVGIMFFDRAEFVTRSVSLLVADFVSRRDLLAIALSPKSSDHLSRLVDLLIT